MVQSDPELDYSEMGDDIEATSEGEPISNPLSTSNLSLDINAKISISNRAPASPSAQPRASSQLIYPPSSNPSHQKGRAGQESSLQKEEGVQDQVKADSSIQPQPSQHQQGRDGSKAQSSASALSQLSQLAISSTTTLSSSAISLPPGQSIWNPSQPSQSSSPSSSQPSPQHNHPYLQPKSEGSALPLSQAPPLLKPAAAAGQQQGSAEEAEEEKVGESGSSVASSFVSLPVVDTSQLLCNQFPLPLADSSSTTVVALTNKGLQQSFNTLQPVILARLPSLKTKSTLWPPRVANPTRPFNPQLNQPPDRLPQIIEQSLTITGHPPSSLLREAESELELMSDIATKSKMDAHLFAIRRAERQAELLKLQKSEMAKLDLEIHLKRKAAKGNQAKLIEIAAEEEQLRWGPPITSDIHYGPVADRQGQMRKTGSVRPSLGQLPRWGLLTTFPVAHSTIYAKEHSQPQPKQLNATASYLSTLQNNHLSGVADLGFWLDSNPCPRKATVPSDFSLEGNADTKSFDLTQKMLPALAPQMLWIQQHQNINRFVDQISPTHVVRSAGGPLDWWADSVTSLSGLDSRWVWNFDKIGQSYQDPDFGQVQPLTNREQLLYFHTNVIEASHLLPYTPNGVFIRKWHGCHNMLVIFSHHLCVLCQKFFISNYLRGLEEIERCALCIAACFKFAKTQTARDAASSWQEAQTQEEATFLQQLTSMRLVAGKILLPHSDENASLIEPLRKFRREEIITKKAIPLKNYSTRLKWLATYYLLPPDSAFAELEKYKPYHTGELWYPPSIIGNMLSYLGHQNIWSLAELERRHHGLDGEPLTPVELQTLERAWASTKWTNKLIYDYQMSPESLQPKWRFNPAVKNYKSVWSDATAAHRCALSFHFSKDTATHLWTAHLAGADQTEQLVNLTVGSHCSVIVRTDDWYDVYSAGRLKLHGVPCEQCKGMNIPHCLMTYREAVLSGHLIKMAGFEGTKLGLTAWLTYFQKKKLLVKHAEYTALLEKFEADNVTDGVM